MVDVPRRCLIGAPPGYRAGVDDGRTRPSLWRAAWRWDAYVMPYARRTWAAIYLGLTVVMVVVVTVLDAYPPLAVIIAGMVALAAILTLEARYRRQHPDALPPTAPGRPGGAGPLAADRHRPLPGSVATVEGHRRLPLRPAPVRRRPEVLMHDLRRLRVVRSRHRRTRRGRLGRSITPRSTP